MHFFKKMIIEKEKIEKKQRKRLFKRLEIFENSINENEEVVFLTITFEDNFQFFEFKENKVLSNILKNLKKNYGVKSYFWVVEFQRRGVIHYHIMVVKEKGKKIGFLDRRKKYKGKIGMTNIKEVKDKRVLRYMLKYLKKETERKKLIIKQKHKILRNKYVKREIRYRRFGFGGSIKKMEEYKEIMESYLLKKIKKKNIKYDKKNRELIGENKKVVYRFSVEWDNELGLEIKEASFEVYRKKYYDVLTYDWVLEFGGGIYIENENDIKDFYDLVIMILEED